MHATLPRIITFIHIYIYVYLRARMKKVPCPTLLYSNTTVALSPPPPNLNVVPKSPKHGFLLVEKGEKFLNCA